MLRLSSAGAGALRVGLAGRGRVNFGGEGGRTALAGKFRYLLIMGVSGWEKL